MKIQFFTFILILTINSNALNATSVYKWLDEDGQVHYGSKPTGKNAKEIEIKKPKIDTQRLWEQISGEKIEDSSLPEDDKTRLLKQKKFLEALEAEQEAVKKDKQRKEKKEELKLKRCNASRDQLRRYQQSSALYDLDEKGNRVLLDKKDYEKAVEQARARVERWCN